jgi:hypothetical protein
MILTFTVEAFDMPDIRKLYLSEEDYEEKKNAWISDEIDS